LTLWSMLSNFFWRKSRCPHNKDIENKFFMSEPSNNTIFLAKIYSETVIGSKNT